MQGQARPLSADVYLGLDRGRDLDRVEVELQNIINGQLALFRSDSD
jgi:hypothetical protein